MFFTTYRARDGTIASAGDKMTLVTSDERVKRRYDYISMSIEDENELKEMGAFGGWNECQT